MSLTVEQIDALQEVMNIGVGRAASTLNDMLAAPVELKVPFIKVVRIADLPEELKEFGDGEFSTVNLGFTGSLTGSTSLMFPKESAAKLVAAFTDDESEESLDAIRVGTLTEIGNIVLNAVMGSIANLVNCPVEYSVPFYNESRVGGIVGPLPVDPDSLVIFTQASFALKAGFEVNGLDVEGGIVMVLGVHGVDALVSAIEDMIPV